MKSVLSYQGIHRWMNRCYPKTGRCEYCGRTDRRTDYASAEHTYTQNRAEWFELCRRCHVAFDCKASSAETKAKISAANKGRRLTPEQRARFSAARKGVPHSAAHRAAIAAALRTTHCHRGHERTQENTYVTPKGKRECAVCKHINRKREV